MTKRPADPRRGAALFVVLLFSALLASLSAVALRATLSGARAAAVFRDAMQADELGRAATDVLAYHLAETQDPGERRGGSIAVRLGEAEITIDYRSESARIDVNLAPIPLISELLATAGASREILAAVADRIARQRQSASGPAQPQPGGPAIAPAAAPSAVPGAAAAPAAAPPSGAPAPPPAIQLAAEIIRLWDLPHDLGARVLPSLTTANGTATIDPVLADRPVLAALLGADDLRIDDYLARRMPGFATKDAALDLIPAAQRAYVGFIDVAAVHAVARVAIARRFVRRYDFVLVPPDGGPQALQVLAWQPKF